MGTFFISPEIFDLLTEEGQAQVTAMLETAVKKGLMISPRGERVRGFGKVVLTVATMTPEEHEQYELSGGAWEFVSGVQWVSDRLFFEDYMKQALSGEGGIA
jgi:hypothetical protein